ncbi:MAG: DNA-3-methyladenine glycosylase [Oscillospiraceae bacterium]|nr:DNA-3-methyladenine glycosylase [Oscillospiraceae bacterium]
MKQQIIQIPEGVALPRQTSFDLEQTLFCGQCFRWHKRPDGTITGIAFGQSLTVSTDFQRDLLIFHNLTAERFNKVWAPYFDLFTDYDAIRARLCQDDPILTAAAAFAPGIRILRQEPWEALCSFIISQNNNIPRIQGIIDRLCQQFGTPVYGGFAFPSAEQMARLSVEDLGPVRCGFRAKYLCSAARLVAEGQVELEPLYTMPLEEARHMLMRIQGVGPKVAECTLLYGFHRLECFPMDVWMKRVMAKLYPGERGSRFGPYAGIAQQYLFHYGRANPQLLE